MTKGYYVFRSLTPNSPYDIIAVKDGEQPRLIEVRTGFYSTSGKLSYPAKLHGSATEFAVVTHTDNKVHYLPV